jgi:nucleotide-binding universal stress UspA family protein
LFLNRELLMKSPDWKRILVTTDFSAIGNKAVSYAQTLAEKWGAELHVLHVVADVSQVAAVHGTAGTFEPDDPLDQHREWLGQLLGESGAIRRVDVVQVGQDVAEKIVQYAGAQAMDLIIMATHGRSGLAHWWLGSVAEKVIRSAACPVLALRPTPEDLAPGAT